METSNFIGDNYVIEKLSQQQNAHKQLFYYKDPCFGKQFTIHEI